MIGWDRGTQIAFKLDAEERERKLVDGVRTTPGSMFSSLYGALRATSLGYVGLFAGFAWPVTLPAAYALERATGKSVPIFTKLEKRY